MNTRNLRIAVHDKSFHTDDVFAVAILSLIYPNLKLIRTRDRDKFSRANLRVDVGGDYNPKTGDFDHHQKEFIKRRKNKIPYSSTGLIWENFGKKLVNSIEAFNYIDKKLIQQIDAHDNGFDICFGEITPYIINDVIKTFLPNWKIKSKDYDTAFNNAVDFAKKLLKKELETANGLKEEKEIIKVAVKKSQKEYLVFENCPPNFQEILLDYPRIKYVIYENTDGNWTSKACLIKKGSFKAKKSFPKKWAGLKDEELAKVTGVDSSIFCHKELFIIVAKTKEGAIRLTELALES